MKSWLGQYPSARSPNAIPFLARMKECNVETQTYIIVLRRLELISIRDPHRPRGNMGLESFAARLDEAKESVKAENILPPAEMREFLEVNKASVLLLDVQEPGSDTVPVDTRLLSPCRYKIVLNLYG